MDIPAIKDYCINSALRTGAVEYGKTLDYSDDSIIAVAEILEDCRIKYTSGEIDEKRAKTCGHIFGVYVGEAMRCNHLADFQWRGTVEHGIILIRDEKTILDPVEAARLHILADGSITKFFNDSVHAYKSEYNNA